MTKRLCLVIAIMRGGQELATKKLTVTAK